MVETVFLANLCMALLVVGACLSHAWGDRGRLAFLATGIVYGVILEQLVILRFEAYHYVVEDFLLTLGDVPVVIGLGWGAIIYSGFHVGKRLELSATALPPFVALFALHIDLSIDAIAIRVPFWTWTPPGSWFGVPLGNFMGWFLVASLFSAGWVAFRPRLSSAPLVGLCALVGALAGIVVLLAVWMTVATTPFRRALLLGPVVVLSSALVLREGLADAPIDPRLAAVPFAYHGYYLVLLLVYGMYREQPLLLVVSLAMLALSGLLHRGGFDTGRGDSIGVRSR